MSKIDWNKAPADAQGFMPYDGMWISGWWKDDGGSRYFWSMEEGDLGGWKKSYANPFEQPGFIKRPSPAWSGEGNPPVGTVCEMTHGNWGHRGWEAVTVKYCSAEYAITTDGRCEQYWHMRNIHFRPIRTPEQIAADEREAAIKEMSETINTPFSFGWVFAKLYDAGWRKIK